MSTRQTFLRWLDEYPATSRAIGIGVIMLLAFLITLIVLQGMGGGILLDFPALTAGVVFLIVLVIVLTAIAINAVSSAQLRLKNLEQVLHDIDRETQPEMVNAYQNGHKAHITKVNQLCQKALKELES